MADQTQRLEIATVRAEVGSNIVYRFANDAVGAEQIPTQSGPIQNLKQVILEIQEDASEKISISTTIYPTVAAGLAASADQEIFLVQSNDADEIYAVWKNEAGTAVNTGKTALSATAIQTALDASNEAAQAAEDAADVATARTAGFLAPSATAPSLRDNGLPLQPGDRYFNTTDQAEYIYKADGWEINDSIEAITQINSRFSLNPAPGKTPEADADGKFGSDWISDANRIKPLAGYDELRAYSGSAAAIQITKSGIDGLFTVSGSGQDNGGTIIVDSRGRSWKRNYSGEINIKWFGAAVDGVTDDTNAVNAATAFCSANGGGTVLVPTGVCRIGSGGIKIKSNVLIKGCGSDNTYLQVAGSPTTVCIEFSLFPADFNYGGVENLTIRNSGLCLAGISTPSDESAFNRAQRWFFDRIHFRGSDMLTFIEIGDCVQGTLTNTQVRASYKATLADAGQNQTVGVRLTGVRGNVGCRVDGLMIIGARVGLHVTGSAEGYFFQNTEVVGSWIGALVDSNPSKPGGFIDNIHFNCSYRCVDLQRRRAANIGAVQCYREYTYFKHGLGWSGVSVDDSAQIDIGSIMVRVGPSFPDIADIAALRCVSARKISIGRILSTEPSTMGLALKATDSVGISVGCIEGENMPSWAEILGTSTNVEIGSVIDVGTQSTRPIVFGTGTSRQNVRAPIPTGVRNYAETTYSSASDVSLSPRVNPPTSRINLNLGSAAYVVNINLQSTYAVNGDEFIFRLNVSSNSNSTINFMDVVTGVNRRQVAATTTAQIRILKFLFNGGGWILNEDLASL